MVDLHFKEPRLVGYPKSQKDFYKDWTDKKSLKIFKGVNQTDLFFFAMAVGVNRDKKSNKKFAKIKNVVVSVLPESKKWGILSTEIMEKKDLLVLKDEREIYESAEAYAEEGIKIIEARMLAAGASYPKELEAELREILKKK